MQNNIQVFNNKDFGEIRTIQIDGVPWFVGKDVTDILGYGNGSRDLNRHVDADDRQNYRNGTLEKSNRGVTIINESGLYSLILLSKLPNAKSFKRWVTSEVLPSIRKHGAYIHDDILEKMRESEEFTKILLDRLNNEKMKNDTLSTFTQNAIAKVQYHDIVLQCPDAVQVSIIAKDYGMSATAFNKLLHKLKVQFRMGKTWLLYNEHQGNGYTITNTYAKNGVTTMIHTLWTQKGRYWLYDLLKTHGILPNAEKLISSCGCCNSGQMSLVECVDYSACVDCNACIGCNSCR